MIYPNFPVKLANSTIGVCAPSAGVGRKIPSFEESLSSIRSLGIEIKELGNVRADSLRPNSGEERGYFFNELIKDPAIDMIISAAGGEFCFEMMPFLDAEAIMNNPKWVAGASDPTSILYYITTAFDIATIYGFNAGSFDWRPMHKFQENALEIISGNIVRQDSFDKYDNNKDWSNEDNSLDGDVYWELYNCPEGKLDVSGRLIGGCSDVLSMVAGTPFDHTNDFLDRYSEEGIIWYFDPFETNPFALHLLMLKFKYMGYFKNAKAIVFGRIMFDGGAASEEFVELLKEDFDCPIVFNADIGHVKPCMTLINGSVAHLECEAGKATLEMKLI